MKIAVHLARNRRLLAWCVLSLVVHVLAVIWIDARWKPYPVPARNMPLAVRLAASAPPTLAADTAPAPAPRPTAAPPPAAATAPVTVPAAVPAPPPDAPAAVPATVAEIPALAEPQLQPGGAIGDLAQAPGRYQVRPPPSSRLTYTVTRTRPGAAAEAGSSAQLAWRREAGKYQLKMDGVLGEFESEGGEDDAGMSPLAARERSPTGGQYVTRFLREEERIEYFGGSARLPQGTQDRASLLIQLAGMGLAEPDQMQDRIEIVVGGATGAGVERFEVMGQEEIGTGIGRLATVRLVQLAQAGERRVEYWLAPGHNWLPVRIRVTEPDGTVADQVVASIDSEAAR